MNQAEVYINITSICVFLGTVLSFMFRAAIGVRIPSLVSMHVRRCRNSQVTANQEICVHIYVIIYQLICRNMLLLHLYAVYFIFIFTFCVFLCVFVHFQHLN